MVVVVVVVVVMKKKEDEINGMVNQQESVVCVDDLLVWFCQCRQAAKAEKRHQPELVFLRNFPAGSCFIIVFFLLQSSSLFLSSLRLRSLFLSLSLSLSVYFCLWIHEQANPHKCSWSTMYSLESLNSKMILSYSSFFHCLQAKFILGALISIIK